MSPPTNAEHDNGTETGTVPAVAAPMTPGANVTAEQSNDKASAPTLLADPSLVVAEKESMHGVVGIEQEQLQNEKEESKQEENDGRASLTQGTTMQEAAAAARQAFSFDSASGPLMESFVQQASSLKTLLSSTLKKRPHEKNSKKNDEPAPEPSPQRRRVVESEGLTAQLVRQKTAEMLTLQHVSILRSKPNFVRFLFAIISHVHFLQSRRNFRAWRRRLPRSKRRAKVCAPKRP